MKRTRLELKSYYFARTRENQTRDQERTLFSDPKMVQSISLISKAQIEDSHKLSNFEFIERPNSNKEK